MSARLIWWQPPEQALRRSQRVIAQVMDLGDYDTVLQLRRGLGDRRLVEVLQGAEAGWFSPRSWTYWHRKLGITPSGPVPPLPTRQFVGRWRARHGSTSCRRCSDSPGHRCGGWPRPVLCSTAAPPLPSSAGAGVAKNIAS